MDNIDKKILSALQDDARITNINLANEVGLSPSACLRRVQSLEQRDIISQYTTLFNEENLGFKTTILLQIRLQEQGADKLEAFEKAIVEIPQVITCILVGGSYDYLIKLVVQDIADYEKLHRDTLSRLPNIASMQSNFALRNIIKRVNPIL